MKYKIFLGSHQKEFAKERTALKDYIEGDVLLRKFFDIFIFEASPAVDKTSQELYLQEVQASMIYIGLFGDKYGAKDTEGISPTHREFIEATKYQKTRLVFIKGNDDTTKESDMQNRLTNSAILLFGKSPQRFFISSEVKCLHFHGKNVAKPIPSYQIYKGTLFELADQALDFVMSKLNRNIGTREQGNDVAVNYEIPTAVLFE